MTPDPVPSSGPTPFQRFEALTRRILTTPKSELVKDAPKGKASKSSGKRKR